MTLAIQFLLQISHNLMIEKSYNKTVIDFNFGRHKDLSTLKSDIHLGLAASVNITFSGRSILMPTSLKSIIVYYDIAIKIK